MSESFEYLVKPIKNIDLFRIETTVFVKPVIELLVFFNSKTLLQRKDCLNELIHKYY